MEFPPRAGSELTRERDSRRSHIVVCWTAGEGVREGMSGVADSVTHNRRGRAAEETPPDDLGQIYDRYATALYRYLLVMLSSREDAEDAVQELFVALSRKGLRGVRHVEAYLFQCARRHAVTMLRRRGRQKREADVAGVWVELAACRPEERELSIDVEKALQSLPVEQQEVVLLYVYEGHSFDDIARLSGLSRNTAASRYRLAMAKLRALLKGDSS